MNAIFILLLLPLLAFSQAKAPIESLFKDLPLEERISKRMELIEDIRSGKEKNYLLPETTVLYALNLKDNPKHGDSWYGWIQNTLATGNLGQMNYSSGAIKKSETMLRIALKKVPKHVGLQLLKIKINFAKGAENYKIKSELDKFNTRIAEIDFADLNFMAELYARINEPSLASDIYKKMEAKATSKGEELLCYQGRGQNARMAENWNDCVDAYQKSDALFPGNQFVLLPIVQCLNKANRFTEALNYAERLKDSPDASCALSDAQIGRGAELGRSGKFTEAEELINKSFKCKKWEAFHELAHIKIQRKDFEGAYEMMMKSSEIRGPGNKNSYLKEWSLSFRPSMEILKRIMMDIIQTEKTAEAKLQGYYEFTKFLVETKDSAAKEIAVKGIAFGTESLKANAENYQFLKPLAGLLTLQGTHMQSPLALEQAQLFLGKLYQMNPGGDQDVLLMQGQILQNGPASAAPVAAPEKVPQPTPVQQEPAQATTLAPVPAQTVPAQAAPAKPPAYAPPVPIQSAPLQQIYSQPAATQPIPVQ